MKTTKLIWALAPLLTIAITIGIFAAQAPKAAAQESQGRGQMNMPYDLHYIDMMLMHHRQGIEMLNLAATKAHSAQVKAFAQKSAADQQRDTEELKKYREQFYAGQPEMKMDDMHMNMGNKSGMGNMQGMGDMKDMDNMKGMDMKNMKGMNMDMNMKATMDRLRAANGAEFDRQFLDAMTSHHQMAREMSKDATTRAEHDEIKNFARTTAAKQWGEIAEMNKLKSSQGGASKNTPAKGPARKGSPSQKSSGHNMPGMKMPM